MKNTLRNDIRIAITLVMVLLLVLTSTVSAQDTPPGDQPGDQVENQGQNQSEEDLLPAPTFGSGLLAYDVIGQNGNRIGDVGGIVLDTVTGQVLYLVIESDNLLNDTDALVPWGAFRVVSDRAGENDNGTGNADPGAFDPLRDIQLVLNITEQEFENAPEFDEDVFDGDDLATDWDQTHRDYWVGLVEGVSNAAPAANTNTSGLLLIEDRLFDAIDIDVEKRDGEDLGEVEDLIINPDGMVSYALVETDSVLDIGDQFVVVEIAALEWNAEDESFFLVVPENFLNNSLRLDPDLIPDMTVENWDAQWDNFWEGIGNNLPDINIPNTGDGDEGEPGDVLPDASNVVGLEVYGAYDNLLGTVVDVMDVPDGSISYMIVDDADQDLYRPVPFSAAMEQTGDRLVIFYSAWRFNHAPGYAELADIPAFDAQPDWDRTVREYWGLPNADQ